MLSSNSSSHQKINNTKENSCIQQIDFSYIAKSFSYIAKSDNSLSTDINQVMQKAAVLQIPLFRDQTHFYPTCHHLENHLMHIFYLNE